MLSNCGRNPTASRRGPGQLCILLVAAAAVCVAASTANASQLIDRDAKNVKLAIDTKGEALITYTKGGQLKHVLVGGAIGALPPDAGHEQVKFWTDFSGGWGKHGSGFRFAGVCKRYTGPSLPWLVVACKAPDGTLWALQSWQRGLPDYGVAPTADQSAWSFTLALVGIATGAADRDRLGVRRSLRPPLRQLHLRRHRRLRLQVDAAGRAAGQLGSQSLRRRVQLAARLRLAARQQLRHAQAEGDVLLRLLPTRGPSRREGDEVPRDDRRGPE